MGEASRNFSRKEEYFVLSEKEEVILVCVKEQRI